MEASKIKAQCATQGNDDRSINTCSAPPTQLPEFRNVTFDAGVRLDGFAQQEETLLNPFSVIYEITTTPKLGAADRNFATTAKNSDSKNGKSNAVKCSSYEYHHPNCDKNYVSNSEKPIEPIPGNDIVSIIEESKENEFWCDERRESISNKGKESIFVNFAGATNESLVDKELFSQNGKESVPDKNKESISNNFKETVSDKGSMTYQLKWPIPDEKEESTSFNISNKKKEFVCDKNIVSVMGAKTNFNKNTNTISGKGKKSITEVKASCVEYGESDSCNDTEKRSNSNKESKSIVDEKSKENKCSSDEAKAACSEDCNSDDEFKSLEDEDSDNDKEIEPYSEGAESSFDDECNSNEAYESAQDIESHSDTEVNFLKNIKWNTGIENKFDSDEKNKSSSDEEESGSGEGESSSNVEESSSDEEDVTSISSDEDEDDIVLPDFIEEIYGDLFENCDTCCVGHCVSEDMRMGSGIAVTFRHKFGRVAELLDQHCKTGDVAVLKEFLQEDVVIYIYYLVTKRFYYNKPTMATLQSSLQAMREHCLHNKVKHIALPRIGCGLDRLKWPAVLGLLGSTFADTGIKITIYTLEQRIELTKKRKLMLSDVSSIKKLKTKNEEMQSKSKTCDLPNSSKLDLEEDLSLSQLTCKKVQHKNLSDLVSNTARVFLAPEGSEMNSTMQDLNVKYSFRDSYMESKLSKGQVFRYECSNPSEMLYGLVVRHSLSDRIDYTAYETCLRKLDEMLKNDGYEYVGIEASYDEMDLAVTEKTITLMKWVLGRNYRNPVELTVCYPTLVLMLSGN